MDDLRPEEPQSDEDGSTCLLLLAASHVFIFFFMPLSFDSSDFH